MDIMQLIPLISNHAGFRKFVESTTKQPVDHVMKCLNTFMTELNGGPGLVNKVAEQRALFDQMYNAGISCGLKEYEAVIAACGFSGYSPIDVVTFFRNEFNWDVTIEEVEMLGKNIAPRFKKLLVQYGYLKPEEIEPDGPGIPKVNIKTKAPIPPWRSNTTSTKSNSFMESNPQSVSSTNNVSN
jgi:hypothetical protein